VETGKAEYLELPVTVIRRAGKPDERVYGVAIKTKTENSKGIDAAAEERSRTDGWEVRRPGPSTRAPCSRPTTWVRPAKPGA
jgi:hypothetical protein